MFVGNVSSDPSPRWKNLRPGQSGYRAWGDGRDDTLYVNVFTHGLDTAPVPRQRLGISPSAATQAVARKTAVHEIGHVLNIGEADDYDYNGDGTVEEVYSSSGNDTTEEPVNYPTLPLA